MADADDRAEGRANLPLFGGRGTTCANKGEGSMIESRLRVRLSEEHSFRSLATSATSFSTVSAAQYERRLPLPTSRLVLLIDNSPTIRHIVERTLRKEGYEVRSFRDGIEAMRWFAEP